MANLIYSLLEIWRRVKIKVPKSYTNFLATTSEHYFFWLELLAGLPALQHNPASVLWHNSMCVISGIIA